MTLPRRPGLFCAAPHPADPTILCALLSGHWPGSLHDDGHGTRWSEDGRLIHITGGGVDIFCGVAGGLTEESTA